jgi:hypothetical protein
MSEDVYVLKEKVDELVLFNLSKNHGTTTGNLYRAISKYRDVSNIDMYPSLEKVSDWIAALKSGKKIVNPMSPREKIKWLYDDVAKDKTVEIYHKQYVLDTLQEFIIQIAKEHPDVTDWLGDKDA